MDYLCAWCKQPLLKKDSDATNHSISHGICEKCRFELEYNRIPIQDLLNEMDGPILMQNSDGRVFAANHAAQNTLKKKISEIQGKLRGDVIECVYAALPGGCGYTEHCSACIIRQTVQITHETGQSQNGIKASHFHITPKGPKRYWITISTEKVGDAVLLRIDDMQPFLENSS
ncbi:MAG: hypothetical protein E4G98_05440 [Promethearchaeota archaeon]|nr:MAG: hypothetical protein E4G98_05440 [Candidatus Lokiarchaeota archaeon]